MKQYVNRVREVIPECMLHLILSVIVYAGALFLARMMWSLFLNTPVGRHHVELFPQRSGEIFEIVNLDYLRLVLFATGHSLKIGFLLSALAQFAHIQKRFFMPFGVMGQMILWGLPVTWLVSRTLAAEYEIDFFVLAFGVSLIPAVWGTMICFRLNAVLIPEAATAFELLKEQVGRFTGKGGDR